MGPDADPDPTPADPPTGPTPSQAPAAPSAAAPSAAAPPDPATAWRTQMEEWKEKALRARADYENLVRRTARDAQAERDRNKARVLEGFLPLAELAHMAAQQAEAHPGPLTEGVRMLAREFDRLLEREGVVRTGTVGESADPARHEVLATEAVDGVKPGCVARVIQPGYLLGDKVLRYAKVAVAPAA
ncbi:MAG TPA: nucleotide exchange factor GrpE [Candidatus Thermoplasmatota archaeon]|nr:nucleotide exchange factor GrpE [Candidatus Thermoplasmatota archaeon]